MLDSLVCKPVQLLLMVDSTRPIPVADEAVVREGVDD